MHSGIPVSRALGRPAWGAAFLGLFWGRAGQAAERQLTDLDRRQVPGVLADLIHGIVSSDGACLLVGAAGPQAEELVRASLAGQLEGVQLARLPYGGDLEGELQLAMARVGCGCGLRLAAGGDDLWGISEYGDCEARPPTERRPAQVVKPARIVRDTRDRLSFWAEAGPSLGWEFLSLGIGLSGEAWPSARLAIGLRARFSAGRTPFVTESASILSTGAYLKAIPPTGVIRPYARLGLDHTRWEREMSTLFNDDDPYTRKYSSPTPYAGGGASFYLGESLRAQAGVELSTITKPERLRLKLSVCLAVGVGL